MRCLAVFALLAGCSGLDFANYPGALTDARCAYYVRCGVVASTTECHAFYDRVALANPSTQAAIDMGKVVYHEAVARDCLDAYNALSCDESEQTGHDLDVCSGVLTGTLGMGETCAFDKECDSGNCVIPTCMTSCCTGSCAAPRALPSVGQPCTALCADDAYCGVDSVCHAPLPAGAACNSEPCEYGLYCAGKTSTSAGTCKALPHIGEPCDAGCAEVGATCESGTCTRVGVLGDPCTSDAQCSMFYGCTNMQCSLFPTLGMPCTTTCYEAAYCDGTLCVAQKSTNAPCVRNDECDSHYCSRTGSTGVCGDLPICL